MTDNEIVKAFYRKIYKTIPKEKAVLIAKISKFNNGRYGFETSNNGTDFEKNINMPLFSTEKEAYEWIETKENWQRV